MTERNFNWPDDTTLTTAHARILMERRALNEERELVAQAFDVAAEADMQAAMKYAVDQGRILSFALWRGGV